MKSNNLEQIKQSEIYKSRRFARLVESWINEVKTYILEEKDLGYPVSCQKTIEYGDVKVFR